MLGASEVEDFSVGPFDVLVKRSEFSEKIVVYALLVSSNLL